MAMFSNAKVGDRVYDWIKGWGNIAYIDIGNVRGEEIDVVFDDGGSIISYTVEGKFREDDANPSLFWDKPKFEIPEKPFNLKEEYKKLERTKNKAGMQYEQITYTDEDSGNNWGHVMNGRRGVFGAPQFYDADNFYNFVKLLNEHKIEPKQLEQVTKEVELEENED